MLDHILDNHINKQNKIGNFFQLPFENTKFLLDIF